MSPNARAYSIAISIGASLWGAPAFSQTSTTSVDREALKKSIAAELEVELRGKVATELKTQLLEELRGEIAARPRRTRPPTISNGRRRSGSGRSP